MGETEQTELKLFIDNDSELYRQRKMPMYKNLIKKMRNGTYNSTGAVKMFTLLSTEGAKKYNKEFGSPGHNPFSTQDRAMVAKELAKDFEQDWENFE